MNLKREPITFSLERLDLHLREPDTVKPMPSTLAQRYSPTTSRLACAAVRVRVRHGT
jgi:hypothetical protein